MVTANFSDIKNLLSEKGDFYKYDLASSNPLVLRVFGKSLVPLFAQATDKLLCNWDRAYNKSIVDHGDNSPVIIKVEDGITAMTLDVIGLVGFSYPFGALDQVED